MTNRKLNLLMAYPYLKGDCITLLKEHQKDIRFVLDSGAFTAWKSGKPIALDDYCKFIESLPFKPWRYFTLDKIGDPEGSFKNYEIMLKRGFKPVPIFTRGEDISMVNEYYKTSDLLGIGGLAGTKGNRGFVKGIMKVINGRKVHWLGFTNQNFVSYYKPYMCDSSSWTSGVRYGRLDLYMGNGKWLVLTKNDFKTKPSQQVIDRLAYYGEDAQKLAYNKEWINSSPLLSVIPMKGWIDYTFQIRKKYNTQMFLAVAQKVAITDALNSYTQLRKLGII